MMLKTYEKPIENTIPAYGIGDIVDFDELVWCFGIKTVGVCDAEAGKTGLPRDLAPCNCPGDRAEKNH